MDEYIVYFHGQVVIRAKDKEEAEAEAYDRLRELGAFFNIDEAEYKWPAVKSKKNDKKT